MLKIESFNKICGINNKQNEQKRNKPKKTGNLLATPSWMELRSWNYLTPRGSCMSMITFNRWSMRKGYFFGYRRARVYLNGSVLQNHNRKNSVHSYLHLPLYFVHVPNKPRHFIPVRRPFCCHRSSPLVNRIFRLADEGTI